MCFRPSTFRIPEPRISTVLVVFLFMLTSCGLDEETTSEPEISEQESLTAIQQQTLEELAAEFAQEFANGVASGDLDPDRELMVVMKNEDELPAAAGPRTSPRTVDAFRSELGLSETRTDLGFASAGASAREAARETLGGFNLEPQWEGTALPVLSVVIPERVDVELLAAQLLQSPNVDYFHANRGSGQPAAGPIGTNPTDTKHDFHGVQRAWDDTRGTGVSVWVLDSGLVFDDSGNPHPDGEWEGSFGIDPKGYVDDYGSCTQVGDCEPEDDHGHGTKMVGLPGQNDNDIQKVGIAPKAEAVSAKIAQNCILTQGCSDNGDDWHIEDDDFLAALDHISALGESYRPEAVSMSFVGDWGGTVEDALADLRDVEGIVPLAGTGNEVPDECNREPAKLVEVYAVGGTTSDTTSYGCDQNENFSALADGQTLEADCFVNALGQIEGSCDPDGSTSTCCTSAATANAAAAVALIRSQYPSWSVFDVIQEIHNHSFGGDMDVVDVGAIFQAH